MRITVGHILIVVGVGAVAWTQVSTVNFNTQGILDKVSSVTTSVDSLMDLFKFGAKSTPPVAVPIPTPTPAAVPPVENPVVVTPPEVTPAVIAPPAKKATVKNRKSKKSRAKTAKDPLLGTMVALTLTSGREVRGILEERSATSYKIQLPGMGPFTYDAANVKAIKPSK